MDHHQFIDLAVHYYVTARFAAKAHYMPVCGNLMHHAVELLLKAGFVKRGGVPVGQDVDAYLRTQFGHRLRDLWAAFKRQHPAVDLSQFDTLIEELDEWEDIRYPSGKRGYAIVVDGRAEHRSPEPALSPRMDFYRMNIGLCDQLFKELWSVVSLNPEWFKMIIGMGRERAVCAYEDDNQFIIYG